MELQYARKCKHLNNNLIAILIQQAHYFLNFMQISKKNQAGLYSFIQN